MWRQPKTLQTFTGVHTSAAALCSSLPAFRQTRTSTPSVNIKSAALLAFNNRPTNKAIGSTFPLTVTLKIIDSHASFISPSVCLWLFSVLHRPGNNESFLSWQSRETDARPGERNSTDADWNQSELPITVAIQQSQKLHAPLFSVLTVGKITSDSSLSC